MFNPLARIRIVDDDVDLLKSMSYLLKSMGLNVSAYSSPKEFLEKDDPSDPGCLILDIRMPDMSGLELQTVLTDNRNPLPIIFCTGHGTINMCVSAMQHGAVNFLEKPVDAEELLKALEAAVKLDEERRTQKKADTNLKARFDTLTPREKEVALAIAKGGSNKDVGIRTGIAEKTVQIHRTSIYKKLRVHSQLEIAELVKKIGLL